MMPSEISRREALKRVIGLSIALSALEMPAFANTPLRGIGTDPNIITASLKAVLGAASRARAEA